MACWLGMRMRRSIDVTAAAGGCWGGAGLLYDGRMGVTRRASDLPELLEAVGEPETAAFG